MKLNHKRIEQELKRLKWKIPKLAEEMGISKQWVYQIMEDGKDVRLSTVQKIADALAIDPKDLIK